MPDGFQAGYRVDAFIRTGRNDPPPPDSDLSGYACWQARQFIAEAYSYGDYETAQYIEEWVAQYCSST